jgi:putative flippase GtrA
MLHDDSGPFLPEVPRARPIGIGDRVTQLFPAAEVLRYVAAGVGNTLFGYACYAAFVALYKHVLPLRYLYLTVDLASITATPIGVTVSFLTYKFLVFRTTGNYLKEWLRCFLVYGVATIPGLFLLPIVTKSLLLIPRLRGIAPYLAGAIVMGGTAVYTYLAHKKFSFSTKGQLDFKAALLQESDVAEDSPVDTRPVA